MSCDNYVRKIKIGLSNEDKQKMYNEINDKVEIRLTEQDKIIAEFIDWEAKGNWLPRYTTTDNNCVVLDSNKDEFSTAIYQGAYTSTSKNILTNLYMSKNEAMFTGNDATYIGFKYENKKVESWSDNTIVYGENKVELETDGSSIILTSEEINIKSSLVKINGKEILADAVISTEELEQILQ